MIYFVVAYVSVQNEYEVDKAGTYRISSQATVLPIPLVIHLVEMEVVEPVYSIGITIGGG